jgi:hypothetical protein
MKITLHLLAASAIGAIMIGNASAMPFSNSASIDQIGTQQARIVCDQYRRCYDTRQSRRRVVRPYVEQRRYYDGPAYYAEPRYGYGYYAPRGYYDGHGPRGYYDGYGPGVSVGVGPFGFSAW